MNGLATNFSHVKLQGNKVAFKLENLVSDTHRTIRAVDWDMILDLMEQDRCRVLLSQDMENCQVVFGTGHQASERLREHVAQHGEDK